MFKRVIIGCDHAAPKAKTQAVEVLKSYGVEVVDCGVFTCDRVDYPDVAADVCQKTNNEETCGILLCGSGIGMSLAANKFSHIRAALCHDHYTASMSRKHNNANVLCMGARTSGPDIIAEMIRTFLSTSFEGGRHAGRVEKIMTDKKTLEFSSAEAKDVFIIGCDHAAVEEKNEVAQHLRKRNLKVIDMGTSSSARVDYPDIASAVCVEVAKTGGRGILVCNRTCSLSVKYDRRHRRSIGIVGICGTPRMGVGDDLVLSTFFHRELLELSPNAKHRFAVLESEWPFPLTSSMGSELLFAMIPTQPACVANTTTATSCVWALALLAKIFLTKWQISSLPLLSREGDILKE